MLWLVSPLMTGAQTCLVPRHFSVRVEREAKTRAREERRHTKATGYRGAVYKPKDQTRQIRRRNVLAL